MKPPLTETRQALQERLETALSALEEALARGDRLAEALHELVKLKDGPHNADYERRKPLAWQQARDAIDGIRVSGALEEAIAERDRLVEKVKWLEEEVGRERRWKEANMTDLLRVTGGRP